jgi:hypothetical protein
LESLDCSQFYGDPVFVDRKRRREWSFDSVANVLTALAAILLRHAADPTYQRMPYRITSRPKLPPLNSIVVSCAAGHLGGHHTPGRCRGSFATVPLAEPDSDLAADCDHINAGSQ